MIVDDVTKALKAYRKLDALGKRIFKDEAKLVGTPRQKRKVRKAAEAKAPRLRAASRKGDTTIRVNGAVEGPHIDAAAS